MNLEAEVYCWLPTSAMTLIQKERQHGKVDDSNHALGTLLPVASAVQMNLGAEMNCWQPTGATQLIQAERQHGQVEDSE